jgi:general secretion pathway protein M
MKDFFDALDKRERLFVASGALLVVLALLYAFVWVPLDTGQKSMTTSVGTWQRSLTEIKQLKGVQIPASATTQSAGTTSQQAPVVIVDQTLRARGLDRSLKRSQPTTSNGIRVEFESVAFDELVLWLGDLSGQYAMHVTSGSMSSPSQAAPGRVNATFTLERS